MNSPRFKVLIIGCGNMAGGYDLHQPADALPMGHAKAFSQQGGFELAACIDPNGELRRAYQNRWQVPLGFDSIHNLGCSPGHFDLISICSPSSLHAAHLHEALELKPRLIFCEKPLTLTLQDTQKAVEACAKQNVRLVVNHSRRWSPAVIELKQQLAQGHWGALRSVSAIYNKGLLNNGTHMLDLLLNLFGPLHITHVGQPVFDHWNDDPSVSICLETQTGVSVQINVAHAQDFAMFEMQAVTERAVISMEDGGASWRIREPKPSHTLQGYRYLNQGDWMRSNGSPDLSLAVSNVYEALKNNAPLACTGLEALQVHALTEAILHQALGQSSLSFIKREAA